MSNNFKLRRHLVLALTIFTTWVWLYAADPTPRLSFIAFGDWGRDGGGLQVPVAEHMARTAAADQVQFVISLGDNFYEDGVSSVEDPQWKTSFEDIYFAPPLQVPWYVILGNHDYHHGNAQAQVDYTLFSPRWKMPARYYAVTRRIDAWTTVEFFMLDTTPYLEKDRRNRELYGDDISTQDTDAQTAWLERKLAQSIAQWKVVCGHHPIYTCGGSLRDTDELVAKIDPLLVKYGVQIYLNGHEHDMQHLRVNGINYFCSGAGASTRYHRRGDERTLFVLGETGGFLTVMLTPDEFRGSFIDHAGNEVYVATISRMPAAHGFTREVWLPGGVDPDESRVHP